MSGDAVNGANWWTGTLDANLAGAGSRAGGLAADEVARRRGPDDARRAGGPGRDALRQLAARLRDPLILILAFAGLVSALTGGLREAALIAAVVAMSIVVDFVQEFRANRAVETLRRRVAVRATVLRDGVAVDVPVDAVVVGDVVLLRAGDLVPADGRLLEARECYAAESLLTGEPYPVAKRVEEIAHPEATPQGAAFALFAGTSLVAGEARLLVMATARDTQLGAIARALEAAPPPTAFELGTRRFGLLLLRLTVVLTLAVVIVCAVRGRPWLESLLFAVALAVGLTPELLPVIVSVTLAHGALHLARRQVIVKHTAAIQNLGAMDVLCTDKTGTLTEARIELDRAVDPLGAPSPFVLELARLNGAHASGLRSPLDDALLRLARPGDAGWHKVAERPFDFDRRRATVLLEREGERRLIVKGAPEDVLAHATRWRAGDGGVQTLEAAALDRLRDTHRALADAGLRTLGVAYRSGRRDECPDAADADLVFAGFCAFLDPPRASAGEAVSALARDGVSVRIVTGDEERVARHVCTALGMPVGDTLSGHDIDALDETALAARVEPVTIFSRVGPAQKERVIRALRRRGHVVGYVGDGINDAPPLHAADVGFSVDGAADVARDAADFVMLEHDLRVLHAGVIEGRRTHANLQKYLLMGTSSNFGNMASMAAAAALLPFLPMLPAQVLLNNLLYDVSEIPLPFDAVDDDELTAPRTWDVDLVRRFMLFVGPVSSVFDLLTFGLLLTVFDASADTFRTGWFVESLTTQVLVVFVIRTRRPPWASRPHPALALVALAIVAIGAWLPATGVGRWFGLVPLPPSVYAAIAVLAVVYLAIVEAIKRRFHRQAARAGRPLAAPAQ